MVWWFSAPSTADVPPPTSALVSDSLKTYIVYTPHFMCVQSFFKASWRSTCH
eukprot:m.232032 g.232032  ORF g.232032 m.232032 type:complete len:52 (+) comp26044_c0_seq1:10-165(+)